MKKSEAVAPLFHYQWSPAFGYAHRVAAQAIGEYLEQAFKGPITVDDLLHSAGTKGSPLKQLFEWNDSTAAVSYRRHQARQFMSHLNITSASGKHSQRAFVSIPVNGRARAYVPIAQVSGDEIEKKAKKELAAWVRRYSEIRKLNHLVGGVYAVLSDNVQAPASLRKRA